MRGSATTAQKRVITLMLALLMALFAFGAAAYVPPLPVPEMMNEKYYVAISAVKKECNLYDKTGSNKKAVKGLKVGDVVLIIRQPGKKSNYVGSWLPTDLNKWSMTLYNNEVTYIETAALDPTIGLNANEDYFSDDLRGTKISDINRNYYSKLQYANAKGNLGFYQEIYEAVKDSDKVVTAKYSKTGRVAKGCAIVYDSATTITIDGKTYAKIHVGDEITGYVLTRGLTKTDVKTFEKAIISK